MKLLTCTLTITALGAAAVFAGSGYDKNPKSPLVVDPRCPCFFEGLQVGFFATGLWGPDALGNEYLDGGGTRGDDALGAGVSFAYYFTENIAVEYSYSWLATESDRHIHALDLLYRMPLGNTCWAPYLMGGAGVNTDGGSAGLYRLGAGVEYRLANCVGIFADYSHNWIAGGDEGWGNDFNLGRAGFRIPF